jgi:CHAT domain-containing protein
MHFRSGPSPHLIRILIASCGAAVAFVILGVLQFQSPAKLMGPAEPPKVHSNSKTMVRAVVLHPDRGELRSDRLLEIEGIVQSRRESLGETPDTLANAVLSLAQVCIELEHFAAAQHAVDEVSRLIPASDAWQNREARLLTETIHQRESGNPQDRDLLRNADRHRVQALRLHSAGSYLEAVTEARQAVAISRRLSSGVSSDSASDSRKALLADSLLLLGRMSLEHGDTYVDAESILSDARNLCVDVRTENHPTFAEILAASASIEDDRGNFIAANQLYDRTLEIYRKVWSELSVEYASILSRQGRMHLIWWKDYAWGKCARAQQIREQILGKSHPDYAESLEDLALMAINLFDFVRAENLAREAFAIREASQGSQHPELARALSLLAVCNTERGNLAEALVNHRRAVRVCERARGKVHLISARYQMYLAQRYDADYDFSRSYRLFDGCLNSLRTLGLKRNPLYADTLFYFADCVAWEAAFFEPSEDPNLRDAEQMLRELISTFDAAPGGPNLPVYAWALVKQVEVHYFENYRRATYSDAWKLFEKAVENVASNGGKDHPVYGELYYARGRLLMSQGDYGAARAAFEKFIEIEGKQFGKVRFNRYLRSISALTGMYLHQGTERERGTPLMRESLELVTERFLANSLAQSDLSRLGLMYHFQYILGAILSTESFSGTQEQLYQDVASSQGAAIASQRPDRAAIDRQQLEPLMGRVRESRHRLKQLAYAPASAGNRDQWIHALQEASDNKEDAENDLALAASTRGQREERFSVSKLHAVLSDDGVFIDYLKYLHHGPPHAHRGPLLRESRMVAFVIRKNQPPIAIPLGPSKPIENAVDRWRDEIAKEQLGQTSDVQSAAVEIARLVWKPLAEQIEPSRRVMIAPDGPLCFLPFAALPGRSPGTYLIEDHTIGYVASARMACELWGSTTPDLNSGFLALGGIQYEKTAVSSSPSAPISESEPQAGLLPANAHWDNLPATQDEAEQILKVYQVHTGTAGRSQLLSGTTNVETFVGALKQKWRYVHFAGHGFFSEEKLPAMVGAILSGRKVRDLGRQEYFIQRNQNLLSGLVLSSTNERVEDTVLTAEEVGSLDLRGTELVVLSACDTGLGRTAGGVGVMGLKRAFLAAGARTVVTSLWKVDDAVTSVLMQQFYENLFTRSLGKLDALRAAQVFVLNHPENIRNYSHQLASRGIKTGRTKQLREHIPPEKAVETSGASIRSARVSPAAWAAFVLYGDGR